MAEASRSRRSVRQADTRKRSVYVDPETDDDFEGYNEEGDYEPLAKKPRLTTTVSRLRRSDSLERSPLVTPSPNRKRRSQARRSKRQQTIGSSVVNKVASLVGRPRRIDRRPRKVKKASISSKAVIPSDGKIPPWQTLPYETLLQIFTYAYTHTTESRTWLVRTGRRVCRAFAEPALTAFYQSPELPSAQHFACLHNLLQIPTSQHWIDYRVKVKRLELDNNVFILRGNDREATDPSALIRSLPLLNELLITSRLDKPPYRRHSKPKWRYPDTLFSDLESQGKRLKAWRWNALFISTPVKQDGTT